MTVTISPPKVSKMLRLYFLGFHEVKIAKKVGVHQSSVSHYATKFKERAEEVGLLVAAKEYGIMEEVEALRSLAVELHKNKLIADDAKEGVKIIKVFNGLGIKPSAHTMLVKVCKEVKSPGFIEAALKLVKIEAESHISYEEAVKKLETMTHQLPIMDMLIKAKKSKLDSINSDIAEKKEELENLKKYMTEIKKGKDDLEKKVKEVVAKKRKEYDVSLSEIKMVAKLKADLKKKGLDIPTLVELAKGV
jgi:predicted transcriptional regulator